MEWNLKLIYESNEAFEAELLSLDDDIKKIATLKGTLNCLNGFKNYVVLFNELERKISKLFTYASMSNDLDQRNSETSTNLARVYGKYNEFMFAQSFVEPELLSNKLEDVLKWCEDKELASYEFIMKKLFRMNAYVKDANLEGVMANYNEATNGYNKLYSQLVIVDNHPNTVQLSDGSKIDVQMANMTYYLGILKNQSDREKVFKAVYDFYASHKSTIAGIYNGIMQSELAAVKNRGYDSILQSHLYYNNIDPEVYLSLINTTKANTAPIKKYYDLRKKYFNLDKLCTFDRFLKFRESNKEYTYFESKRLVLEACSKMGSDFYDKACLALLDGRVSVAVKDGKRTGAYSTGTYNEGSFILLNHSNDLSSAFTIAHEAGHSIHTLYANEAQPIELANYTIFVAEVASTFNEQLFLDYMMEHTTDKNERIVLLQESIDGLIGTFYRQALFADYEYQAHKLVENNIPVNHEELSKIMINLYNDYYGIDISKEPGKQYVWAYIPHFYNSPFYVYQYATSYSASLAIYDAVKNNKEGAYDAYINLLKSGGSDYPVELLKRAGVDLTTSEPFMAVVNRLADLVDMLESELNND